MCSALLPVTAMNDESQVACKAAFDSYAHLIQGTGDSVQHTCNLIVKGFVSSMLSPLLKTSKRRKQVMRRAKRERANECAPDSLSWDARRTALPQNCSTKTLAHRSTSVNSTPVRVNSTTVLQENVRTVFGTRLVHVTRIRAERLRGFNDYELQVLSHIRAVE